MTLNCHATALSRYHTLFGNHVVWDHVSWGVACILGYGWRPLYAQVMQAQTEKVRGEGLKSRKHGSSEPPSAIQKLKQTLLQLGQCSLQAREPGSLSGEDGFSNALTSGLQHSSRGAESKAIPALGVFDDAALRSDCLVQKRTFRRDALVGRMLRSAPVPSARRELTTHAPWCATSVQRDPRTAPGVPRP